MEIIEPAIQLLNQLTYSKDIPLWDLVKTVVGVPATVVGGTYTFVKFIKKIKNTKKDKKEALENKNRIQQEKIDEIKALQDAEIEKIRKLKERVKDDLIFLDSKLSSKNFITIISDNTISLDNMHSINEYRIYLLTENPTEFRDYTAIKNLFEKNEIIKSKLNRYINVSNGGTNKAGLNRDPDFGILNKNYVEMEALIKAKILTL